MSVLVVHICSYGPDRRRVSCQSSWPTSVLTALLGVTTHASRLMSVLVVHTCSYGPVRRHDLCRSSWFTSVLTALTDVVSHVNPRGPHLFLRPC
ncbi:hypothetical protein RRG08_061796 [Elysia crispata]|uniref:Uncharacterized protein n=1 Tax=Elysia crispata TaxID=231223 RepID=A0AAE1CTV4_9GAST|nr:hypothetical protein RRG08_061796 [Elysia crispata]